MTLSSKMGLHTFEANVCFFENSVGRVRVGGYYVIEDASTHKSNQYEAQLAIWRVAYPTYHFEWTPLLSIRNPHDNNLIIIKRLS